MGVFSGFVDWLDYWPFGLLAIILGVIGASRALEAESSRRTLDRIKLRLPLYGDVARKSAISRFTRTLGTLLKSGVPILGALTIARDAIVNRVLMEDIDEASAAVRQGRGLAEVLRESGTFPPMVADMIAVGEEAGNLDEVLVNVADSYDRQVDRAVRVFVSLFEPAMLFVMAAIVGFIVISMLLPVFELSASIE